MKYLPTVLIFFLLAGSGAMGQMTKTRKPGVNYDSLQVEITTDPPTYEWEYYPVFDGTDTTKVDTAYGKFAWQPNNWNLLIKNPPKYDTVIVHGLTLVVDEANYQPGAFDSPYYLIFWQQKQIDSLILQNAALTRLLTETRVKLDSLVIELRGKSLPDTGWHLAFSIPVPPGTVGWYKWHDKDSVTFFGFYHGGVISDYDKPFVSGHL